MRILLPHRRALRFALPALATAALACDAASAAEPPSLGWIDRVSASSDCIGEADTPLCAVETALACRLRRDPALCVSAGLNPDEVLVPTPTARPPAPDRHPAEVIEASAVTYRIDDVAAQPGVVQVAVALRFHGADGLVWPDRGWRRMTYSMTRDAGGAGGPWRVDEVRWAPLVRWLGPADAASRCIGDPKTPLCAVETHMACRVRSDDRICAAAGRVEARHLRPHHATVLYFVDRIRRREPSAPARQRSVAVVVWMAESTDFRAPGDTLDSGEAYITRPHFVLTSYIVERRGPLWRVVGRAERP